MPITNRDQYPDEVFLLESDFLEIGTRSNGAKIIQVGAEGDAPLVAFAYTDDPTSEDLHAIELWSLMKFSLDPDEYRFYDKPKKLNPRIRAIYKFKIPSNGEFSLDLPDDAEILTVQLQNNEPCLWALFSPIARKCSRDFLWMRTGEEIEHGNAVHIATLQLADGKKVSHLFELKVDYWNLEKLVSRGQWREADLETFRILGKLCGVDSTPDGSYICRTGISEISCTDLRTIDQIWSKYSNGRFGYTAQASVLQKFYRSRKLPERDRDSWKSYCDYVGWNTAFSVLNFSMNASKGHLPAIVAWGMCKGPSGSEDIYRSLLSRLGNCNSALF